MNSANAVIPISEAMTGAAATPPEVETWAPIYFIAGKVKNDVA